MPGKWWMRFKPLDELLQICLVTSLLCWSQVLVIRCLRMLLRGLSMAASELFNCSAQWYTQWQSTYPLSQRALCYSSPSCEPSRNLHRASTPVLWSYQTRHRSRTCRCAGWWRSLSLYKPGIHSCPWHHAGCTSPGGTDVLILHNEDGPMHGRMVASF